MVGLQLERRARPGRAHTVALLNRGLPGSLVTPGGDACISLMRACSAWPSGTWMDGEKRTVPDGSSFAWQHWSHTFEYALASGSGDWRTIIRVSGSASARNKPVKKNAIKAIASDRCRNVDRYRFGWDCNLDKAGVKTALIGNKKL